MREKQSYRDVDVDGIYPGRVEANPMQRVYFMHRQVVLNIVRRCQPVTRRDIARKSGLPECTVGSIVIQLTREGMVNEQPARTSRGRPPYMISTGKNCDLSVLDLNIE
jgi:hypothetical protein